MKLKLLIFTTSIFVLFSCATSYHIVSDFERQVDFQSFSTYKIEKHDHDFPNGVNPINGQRIGRAIDLELQHMGYQSSADPDLLVTWFVKVDDVRVVNVYRNYYRRWSHFSHVDVRTYQQGTFVIDIIDTATDNVVWHGKTKNRIFDQMPNVEQRIRDEVREMFMQYARDIDHRKSSVASTDR